MWSGNAVERVARGGDASRCEVTTDVVALTNV